MSKGDPVDLDEKIVRAGMYPYWDAELRRATPSAFTASEVSVSRSAVLDLAQIISIFKTDFDDRVSTNGEPMRVRGVGQAIVNEVIRQAEEVPQEKNKELSNVVLTVIEDRIENEPGVSDNPAHALICGWKRENLAEPRKISRGVANRLLCVFKWDVLSN
jgi:ribosomal protein S13